MPGSELPAPPGAVRTAGPVISAAGLARSFGPVRAVRGVDLEVGAGELFGLVGPDGAGKSTFIRMLCGMLAPDGGGGAILGRDIRLRRGSPRSGIGYLSQRFSLYGDLSVDENIEFFAELHRVYDYRALREEMLGFTGLAPFRGRLAERLSGGMRQKLALICALIHRPRLLLLDEPTTGVDPVSRRELWGLFRTLNEGGMTILLATPYLDEAERCSRVAFMHRGAILRLDTPDGLRRQAPGRTLEILCSDPRGAAAALAGAGAPGRAQAYGDRVRIAGAEEDDDPAARIAPILAAAGIAVESWRFVRPSLEDVFIHLMGGEQ